MSAPMVVGIDGSPQGWTALAWAREEAVRRGAPLRLVHVAEQWAAREPTDPRIARVHEWMRRSAQQVVDEGLAATARDGDPEGEVEATGTVRYGEPARELLAEGADASLLVLGGRGLGGFAGLLLGSAALHVTAHATCPVVVVRPDPGDDRGHREPYGREHGEIVVGVDGSAEAQAAAYFAASEAALRDARLRVVRARANPLAGLRQPPGEATDESAAEPSAELSAELSAGPVDDEAVAASVADLRRAHLGLDVRYEVLRGRAASVLTTASAAADLLVVGSRGRSALRGLVLGSVSHAMLHHARCPVVVVPARPQTSP